MKKTIAILLALGMCVGAVGCTSAPEKQNTVTQAEQSGNEVQVTEVAIEPITEEKNIEDFPVVGMWKDVTEEAYWRILEDGTMTQEFVLTSTSTVTTNGVSSTTTSKRIQEMPDVWEIQNEKFMLGGKFPYEMIFEEGYALKNENKTYERIGEIDYVISLDDEAEESAAQAKDYTVGETLVAEDIELIFSEKGIADDIRISSTASGIMITSGPSPETDKQFVYLKGTLKYTGKTSAFPAIGGKVVLDGYEYKVSISLVNEDGTPCSKIDPLDSVNILLYAHVPVELTTAFATGEITFGFNDNFENVDIADCDYLYKVDAATLKP